jgi:2-haloacid dehalogenase
MELNFLPDSDDSIKINRRQFITTGVYSIATVPVLANGFEAGKQGRIRAVAFDAFPIFDPRPVFDAVGRLLPEKAIEIASQWRTSQFEYSWLRAAAGQYQDFWQVTRSALIFAAKKSQVVLSSNELDQLMTPYMQLTTWPDVKPALEQLQNLNLRICFLSNLTGEMLAANMKYSGIEGYFETSISTDREHTFKPNRKAYELGLKTLQLTKEEILFVAFAGWDACGAKWFGYPTFWLNRLRAPEEQLDVHPDGYGTSLKDLLTFIKERNSKA